MGKLFISLKASVEKTGEIEMSESKRNSSSHERTQNTSSSVSREEGVNELKSFKDLKAEMSVGKLVAVLIFVVIAMALLPTILDSTTSGQTCATDEEHEGDYSSAGDLIGLLPLFYVIAILVAVIVWVVHETKGMGG
jgi:hypothetical protein